MIECKKCNYYPCNKTRTIEGFINDIQFYGIKVILNGCDEFLYQPDKKEITEWEDYEETV